jgi:signal transduction histidine kinase
MMNDESVKMHPTVSGHVWGIPLGYVAAVLTTAILVVDYFTPLGYAVPVLYLLPLALVGVSGSTRMTYGFWGLVAGLSIFGLIFSPPGGQVIYALYNRAAIQLALFALAVLLISHRESREKLVQQFLVTRTIMDAVAATTIILDKQGRVSAWTSDALSSIPSLHIRLAERHGEWHRGARGPEGATPDHGQDHILQAIEEVVRKTRTVYSSAYQDETAEHRPWYLVYAKSLGPQEGTLVAHIDISDHRRLEASLQQAQQHVLELTARREQLSRDLHDDVLQRLFGLGLKLTAWSEEVTPGGGSLAVRSSELINDLNQVIRTIRRFLEDGPLNSQRLPPPSFSPAVKPNGGSGHQ